MAARQSPPESVSTKNMARRFDAIILGAGAAGLFCAAEAGRRGRRIALLERSERAGKKILISGGGRCNFTNLHCTPENFLSANPHFAKSALARYAPADFIALVEKHKIAYHEKTLGQLFCDHSATEITGMLEAECSAAGVEGFSERAGAGSHKNGGVCCSNRNRGIPGASAGGGDGRAFDYKNGGDAVWVRAGTAIWIENPAHAACSSTTRFRPPSAETVLRPGRYIRGSDCHDKWCRVPSTNFVPGKNVDYPPRAKWPGDPAGFVLLAARQNDHAGPGT